MPTQNQSCEDFSAKFQLFSALACRIYKLFCTFAPPLEEAPLVEGAPAER